MDGILLINKPIGVTSRDVVNQLSRKFKIKKMGHTGTLDPFASGLMLVTVNRGTKITTFIEGLEKEYVAQLKLGVSTDTQDLEGTIIKTTEVPLPLDKDIFYRVLPHFIGEIEQLPPMYSAIKIGGEELYKKARRGEDVERAKRRVKIEYIKPLSFTNDQIIFQVKCSKGTYIRTLGSDIADKMGYGGHLTLLTRTKVGSFDVKDSKTIEEVQLSDIVDICTALKHIPQLVVQEPYLKKILNGVKVDLGAEKLILLKDENGTPLAIYQKENDGFHHCLRGLH